MGNQKSGTYVIDSDYNIVAYNETVKNTFPQLVKGEKCHKCLMNLDEPCSVCPVLNHVDGPKTYFDPIRKIYETVDAVDLILEDGSTGHALVLSTMGERAQFAKKMPDNEDEFNALFEQEYHDKLTGGLSRLGFIREVERILADAESADDYVVLLFNLKNFKAVNELFGVLGGDTLLREMYEMIQGSALKPLVTARLEADRMVCLIHKDNLEAEKLEKLLEPVWEYNERSLHLHCRCGIYFVESGDIPVSSMIDRASLAKQLVEDESTKSYAIYDRSMQQDYISQAEMLGEYQSGIRNEEFKVFYQPLIEAATGRVVSAEALVRWQHPRTGFISPGAFIPVLEKNGAITQLDRFVIHQVYRYLESREAAKRGRIPVSINLSWQDFYDDRLMNEIMERLNSDVLPKGQINYEVTETAFSTMQQSCAYLLDQFRQCGAKVLLDDFGSGYSSFGMLRHYSFDIVKIDMSFVRQIEDNERVRSIIGSIIEMSHKIGLKVIAEGVETETELAFLKNADCDYIQGYYYSRPLSETDFSHFLDAACTLEGNDYFLKKEEVVEEPKLCNTFHEEQHALPLSSGFLFDILDHSGQFIQICHPSDYSMVYANQVTRMISVDPDKPYRGEKCYEYMLGNDKPCAHCPMQKMDGSIEKEIEVDDGDHVFALKARYMELDGQKIFVEYGRDITEIKRAQHRYESQIQSILESIPDEQGVFHVDLTADEWISSGGNAQNARDMQDVKNVDTLIHMIASFVPDKEGEERFFRTFCRDALLKAHENGRRELSLETLSYYDDRSIRWSRINARLLINPKTTHLEGVIYGVDISKEKAQLKSMETELEHVKKQSKQEIREAMDLYSKADHDRRIDFLTGLHNRLDLFEALKESLAGSAPRIQTMYMIDIDNFKQLNDKHGHLAGDECLRQVGALLRAYGHLKKIRFYRYGGEEFLGIDYSDRSDAGAVAEELLNEIRSLEIEVKGRSVGHITVSLGYTSENHRYEKMIDMADQAMYRAKKRGKDQAVCYDRI